MKHRSKFPPFVILILAALLVTTAKSAAVVPAHGPSAVGAGLFSFRNSNGDSERWSFWFEAIANKNGQTRGRARFENLSAQTYTVVRIDCLSVTSDSNSAFAVIGGSVLHTNDRNLLKSEYVIFAASDGPWPPVSSSDIITPPFSFPFPGWDCHEAQPLTALPVENGDIQIQP